MKICVEQKEDYLDICTNRENIRCLNPVDIYCVTDQKVVCCKYLNLSYIIELVVSMLNCIQSHGNNYYYFHEFLSNQS